MTGQKKGNDMTKMSQKQRQAEIARREAEGIPVQKKRQIQRYIKALEKENAYLKGRIADLESPTLQNQRVAALEKKVSKLEEDRTELMDQRLVLVQRAVEANEGAWHLKQHVSKLLENDPESQPLNQVMEKVKEFRKLVLCPVDEVPNWIHLSVRDPNEMVPRSELKREAPESSEPRPEKAAKAQEAQSKLEKLAATMQYREPPSSSSRSTSQASRTSSNTAASSSSAVWNPKLGRHIDPETKKIVASNASTASEGNESFNPSTGNFS